MRLVVFAVAVLPIIFALPAMAQSRALASAVSIPAAVTEQESGRPFSALGMDAKIGVGGIGFDVATPLAPKLNLRGGAYFFGYNTVRMEDDVNFNAKLLLRSGQIIIDWFPRGGSFRISGGVQAYNSNQVTGDAFLSPGHGFTINHKVYFSSAADPVRVSGGVTPGHKVSPIITVGWGNIVPRRRHSHFSVPMEIGFIYTGSPAVSLNFTGSTCDDEGESCQSVANNAVFRQDVTAQKNRYERDLSPIRFYPVISIGFGYKF